MTLTEAAELLGMSRDALRMRVRRGSLASEKGEDGRVYVFVELDQDRVHPQAEDEGSALEEPLVEELRDRLRYVEDQLAAEREAHAESRRLLLAALEKIPPAIEAPTSQEPSERSESPESAADEQQGRGPVPDAGGPMAEGAERPWWRRVFGG